MNAIIYILAGLAFAAIEIAMCRHDGLGPPNAVQVLALVFLWPVVLLSILALLLMVLAIETGIWLLGDV